MRKHKKFLIIGSIPLPIGGVTIHVQRLCEHLNVNEIGYIFYDLKKFFLYSFFTEIRKSKYAHLHTSSPHLRFLFVIVCFLTRTKSIITIHGNIGRFNRIKNIFDKLSIRLSAFPIVINDYSYNIAIKLNANVKLFSAYLPPLKKEELSINIKEILNTLKSKYKYLVVTNAYAMSFDKDGNEIYGIDFLINFFKEMKEYALVISDPSGDYDKKYSCQLDNIKNIEILNYPHPFFRVLEFADIFIRNTSTDGDSLSIHEALDLGVTVIATNVVDRPKGVYTINRDDENGLKKMLLINKQNDIQLKKQNIDLIDFYKNILK